MGNRYKSAMVLITVLSTILPVFAALPAFAEDLVIAKDAKTDYQIVIPVLKTNETQDSSGKQIHPPVWSEYHKNLKDEWNARFLAWFLKQKTGAEFPVVTADKTDATKPAIYIGVSEPVKKLLGESPYAGMKDQDHIVRSIGRDILLYGEGYDADFYALMDFLDHEFSFRYYWGWPEIEKQSLTVLKPMDRKLHYALRWRMLQSSFTDYLQGENVRFPNGNIGAGERLGNTGGILRKPEGPAKTQTFSLQGGVYPEIVPKKIMANLCHTAFCYIPCKHPRAPEYAFIENKDYFETNPEFFGMGKTGARSPDTAHLCFSNAELKKEFTRNIEKHLKVLGTDNVLITVSFKDEPGKPCFCKDCEQLEEKYGTPGAALFEYIFELAEEFKTKHPQTTIMVPLYRESQTQFPPVLEDGRRFPDNVLFCYAGLSFKTNRSIKNPVNKKAYDDLVQWSKISKNMYVWAYYSLYGDMMSMPYAADKIVVEYIQEVAKLGLMGMFFEFTTYSTFPPDQNPSGLDVRNFSTLDKYLFFRFAKNPSLDYETEVTDYMEHAYGPVAKLAKQYHDELQYAGTEGNPYPMPLEGYNFEKELKYLSPENVYRWEKLCDEMERTLGDKHPEILERVKLLRKPLDTAVYELWAECTKKYPNYFSDPVMIRKRIGNPSTHPSYGKLLEDFLLRAEMRIKYGEKPLPEQFQGISSEKIKRLLPKNKGWPLTVPKIVSDPEAAFGYAASIDKPDLPFHFGYYSADRKEHGPKVILEEGDIEPEKYKLYHLGKIQPSETDCMVWFSSLSWSTHLEASSLYDFTDTTQKWDTWVSLKFPKNFSGKKNDLVLCDQIIVVKE